MGHVSYFGYEAIFLLSLFLLSIKPSPLCDGHEVLCKAQEREALLDFKNGLYGYSSLYSRDHQPRKKLLASWVSGEEEDCCTWEGIDCDNRTGHVTKLVLVGARGNVSPSLARLRYLQHLDLNYGDFGESHIPEFMGSFPMLKYLDLSLANFSGVIPYQLGNLSMLQVLNLSWPYSTLNSDGKWLSHLTSLRYLDINGVDLPKATSLFQELNKLPFISRLGLSACNLDPISLSLLDANFTQLSTLDISTNFFEGYDMSYKIPKWILNLTSLEYLNLSYNGPLNVDGIAGKLCNLRSLHLSETGVNTSIDYFFSGCNHRQNLEDLNLFANQITGKLPAWLGEYDNNLKILDLGENFLSGSIPKSIGGMKSLEYLDLSYNNLVGSILVSIGKLLSCYYLDMSYNNLSGIMPSSFGQLQSLEFLLLNQNSLEGILTEAHFIDLTKLDYLDFSGNSFKIVFSRDWIPSFSLSELHLGSCDMGPQFPSWLQTQKKLQYLDMSSSRISDVLPQWIWNFSSLIGGMDLSLNKLRGNVPIAMNGSSIWQYINLHSNMLNGSLSSFPVTRLLLLSNNSISGPINLRNLSFMNALNLSMNYLSGTIPSTLCDSDSLNILDLSENNLYGQLPSCNRSSSISNSCIISLLYLNNNQLEGDLPAWLGNCKDLTILFIGNNQFTGNLPRWINMSKLQVLSLSSNSFIGSIPSELSCLEYLLVLDLANNHFSGHIPRTFGNFTAMKPPNGSVVTVHDTVYIEITLKGQKLGYKDLYVFLRSIDLSGNEISGEIPEDLGELHGLINLNLSRNYLTGNIPGSFSNFVQLESLDLSRNNLSGNIPQSLIELTSLSSFDVSFNNLSGRIPTGNQFDTFDDSSYLGNKMLCGKPLDTCESLQPLINPATKKIDATSENGGYNLWLYISLALGCIMGFWIFWGTLFLIRSWRYTYFRFIDRQCRKVICLLNE